MGATNQKGDMIFTIKESKAQHVWERNNEYFNQWRVLFDGYSIDFMSNAALAINDIIRERKSLEKKK